MSMNLNGIGNYTQNSDPKVASESHAYEKKYEIPEQYQADNKSENLEETKKVQERMTEEAREEARLEEEAIREKLQNIDVTMSESDMKELLILMGSRGDTQTIEKLVETVKREREASENR